MTAVRLGLIGPRGFGQLRLRAAAGQAELAVVAAWPPGAPLPEGVAACDSLDALLAVPSLDGVIVAAPNPRHAELARAALAAGKHVLVEKPLANTVAECAEVVRAAAQQGRVLAVGHNSRRAPHARALRRLVDEGALGRVVAAEAHFSHSAGLALAPGAWRASEEACPGGPLNLLGIHEIDTLQYLLGPVARVTALQRHLVAPVPIPDVTVTLLEFASGALGSIGAHYVTPWARALRLFGTAANARWDEGGGLLLDTAEGSAQPMALPAGGDPLLDTLREELAEFTRAIRGGPPPEVDGVAGLRNVAVMEAAVESNRRGAAVEVAEIVAPAGVD
jgi:predicted dehydrogenase